MAGQAERLLWKSAIFSCFWKDSRRLLQSLQGQALFLSVSPSVLLASLKVNVLFPSGVIFSLPLISSILPLMCWVWFSLCVSCPHFIWLFLIDYSFLLKFTDLKMIGKMPLEKILEGLWSSVGVFFSQ